MAAWIYTVLNTASPFHPRLPALPHAQLPAHEGTGCAQYPPPGWNSPRPRRAPLPPLVSLLFSAAVLYGLVNWATTTWSSQGRLAFTAISTLTTLFLLGLVGWLPRRTQAAVAGALALFLFAVAAAAPFPGSARLCRRPPVPDSSLQPLDVSFGGAMRLVAMTSPAAAPLSRRQY
jgi:hypothetical protein